jgi:hypothetical protein
MAEPSVPATPEHDTVRKPFEAIALLLKSVRESLEGVKRTGQAPRWVRIARIRAYQASGDFISLGVIPAVDKGFVFTICYLADLALKAKDLLCQADSAKALVEVSGEMLQTLTTKEFAESLANVAGYHVGANPLAPVGPFIGTVLDWVDKIPSPEELESIGRELYRLLNIEQLPLDDPAFTKDSEGHVDVANSGKVRLLQMALTASEAKETNRVKTITVRGLGKEGAGSQAISWLGGRRVREGREEDLPSKAKACWGEGEYVETLYEFSFAGAEAGKDIEEANLLLESMGYPPPRQQEDIQSRLCQTVAPVPEDQQSAHQRGAGQCNP